MAKSGFTEWDFQVMDARTDIARSDAGKCSVFTNASSVLLTIYADDLGTAKTNSGSTPVSLVSGRLRFWTVDTVTSLDVSGLMATGEAFFCKGLAPSNHRIVVDPEKADQLLTLHYSAVLASVSVDTGYDMPENSIVDYCFMRTTVVGTAAIIDVGLSSDRNGFIVEQTCVATGYKVMAPSASSGAVSGSIGALLANQWTVTNTLNSAPLLIATAVSSIVYDNSTATSLAGTGYIYIKYRRTQV